MELRLLELRGQVSLQPRVHYIRHPFDVPDGVTRLRVCLRYHNPDHCHVYLSVFGPNGFRGTRMLPGAMGDLLLELDFGLGGASLGALAGSIESGRWQVQLDVEHTDDTQPYLVTVEASREPQTVATPFVPAPANGRAGAGWYRGELHCHSNHSDGFTPVKRVVEAARKYGLDFLALTDHFTHAGWAELRALSDERLCVMPGLELTGHAGHANLHGLEEWVNTFVDDIQANSWGINDAARATRSQGGLFCVNHPFALILGWAYQELDWSLVDALEVYHHLEGPNNTAQLTFWDGLLRAGRRITGVAGTDSHDAFKGRHRLGQVCTVVQADALSPQGILEGVRRGRTYISLGPELRFTAQTDGHNAGMGDSLPSSQPVRLEIGVSKLERPARVLVMKNGLYFAHRDVPASEAGLSLSVHDDQPAPGYYRVEVFARDAQPASFTGREWQNTLVLSNPIFVD
jgi:hypothetical protein